MLTNEQLIQERLVDKRIIAKTPIGKSLFIYVVQIWSNPISLIIETILSGTI